MKIYIPTRGRLNDQITVNNLPRKLQAEVILVVDKAEEKAHKDMYGHGWIIAVPEDCNSIGKVRQFIVDQHNVKKHGPKIMMLDDDLGFDERRMDIPERFIQAKTETIVKNFSAVEKLLDDYAHGGIRYRQLANVAPLIDYNCRVLRALAYDVDVLRKHNVRFDRIIVMEDFDVTLQLLRLGYSNFSISTIIQGQGSSNAVGGCSIYRDHLRQAEGANGLAALHPDFVKVRTAKTNWKGWGSDERVDVTVRWKKAYESSLSRTVSDTLIKEN